MKFVQEFNDPATARALLDEIGRVTTREWSIMEVCGGQTHAIIANGIDQLLPEQITMLHGPGCPVCVTPVGVLDAAMELAAMPDVIFCTFGDMLRVPGSTADLFAARSEGADVRVVYSPLDAVRLAGDHPDREVVFFAVGFETTAPNNAMAVEAARQRGITNFSMLVSHVLVPPAIDAVAGSTPRRVDAFLAAGHVNAVMGTSQYVPLVDRHRVPIVVTGFEPVDVLDGILRAVVQLEAGEAKLENAYRRVASDEGNVVAQQLLEKVFATCDRNWRGMGELASSGWRLAPAYAAFDAELKFGIVSNSSDVESVCRSGEVLQGLIAPDECEAFGTECTPRHPLGATMVSSEGACAAYHTYRRVELGATRG